jgi:hypothetical protein
MRLIIHHIFADDRIDRQLLDTPLSDEDDKNSTDEEALVGELTDVKVATYVSLQLRKIAQSIKAVNVSLSNMREGCHPFIFYHRVRPFLSAWKNNPTVPLGVIYEGVSTERQQFYGGSAAQSSFLPFLDIGLGVSHHSTKSNDFLMAMRDYMPTKHREFLEYMTTVTCIRGFVTDILKTYGISDKKPDVAGNGHGEKADKESEKGTLVDILLKYDIHVNGFICVHLHGIHLNDIHLHNVFRFICVFVHTYVFMDLNF